MSAGKELSEIDTWLRSTLAAGTALTSLIGGTANPRIYAGLAPQGAPSPFVLFDVQDVRDETGVAGHRGAVRADYLVRAITEGPSFSGAATIMAQADLLLHQSAGTVMDGTVPVLIVQGCVRLEPVRYFEVDAGVRYNHFGGIYRIWAHEP